MAHISKLDLARAQNAVEGRMSEAAFDYSRAVRDAGWHHIEAGYWVNPTTDGCYEGSVRDLCFFLGIGPEFEAWKLDPYVAPAR
jgi:hypothetical protein